MLFYTIPIKSHILGHILSSDLDDKRDIIRAVKDLNHKSNSLFCIIHAVDPFGNVSLLSLTLYLCIVVLFGPSHHRGTWGHAPPRKILKFRTLCDAF